MDTKNHDLFNEFMASINKAMEYSYQDIEKNTISNLLDKLVSEGVLEEWETTEYRELSK